MGRLWQARGPWSSPSPRPPATSTSYAGEAHYKLHANGALIVIDDDVQVTYSASGWHQLEHGIEPGAVPFAVFT